jgi:beta-phosphoglucomutase
MPRSTSAIIFDMDGVITHTMPYHFKAWRKVFSDAGISVDRFEVYSREGQKGLNSVLEIFAKHQRPVTRSRAKELLAKKERLFKSIAKERFIPGARGFIKKCRRSGCRLALVTGTSRHEVYKILPAGLIQCFDIIVSGGDVKHGKPHPEPYLKAMKALNIAKKEVVVIENAPYGIKSAKQAGLTCLALKTSLPKEFLKGADRIFNNFQELERYLHDRTSKKRSPGPSGL